MAPVARNLSNQEASSVAVPHRLRPACANLPHRRRQRFLELQPLDGYNQAIRYHLRTLLIDLALVKLN